VGANAMQRKLLIVMMLTAVFAAEGCRPSRSKKLAIKVDRESDFVYVRPQDELGAGLKPKEKNKKDNETEEARKQREKKEADDRRQETQDLGKWLLGYRGSKPAKDNAFDKVRLELRREGKLEWYEDVDKGKIEVVYLAQSGNPKHVICYHKTVETQEEPAKKGTIELGHPAVFANGAPGFVGKEEIAEQVKKQEIEVCWYYFVKFAMPAFWREAAPYEPYDPFGTMGNPPVLMGIPPVFLSRIKAELVKDPPEKPSFDRFKKYLEAEAPPRLLKLIEDNKMCVSMEADLRKPNELVACWVTAEPTDRDRKERGSITISTSGQPQLLPTLQVSAWMATIQQKKN
jgi:hypothetical protein